MHDLRAWLGEEAGVARAAARVDTLLLPVIQQLIKDCPKCFQFNSVGLVSSALAGYFGRVMTSKKRSIQGILPQPLEFDKKKNG